jgi:PAS domain S-box-containing protein
MNNESAAKDSDTGPCTIEDKDDLSIQLEHYRIRLSEAEQELTDYESIVTRLSQTALQTELLEIELHQIFNSTGDGMWVIDRKWAVQRVNERMLRLLGKTREQAIGEKCHELLNTNLCGTAGCPMVRVKRSGRQVECDIQKVSDETGKTRHFILTASPFSGLDSQLIGIVTGLKDITARKSPKKRSVC